MKRLVNPIEVTISQEVIIEGKKKKIIFQDFTNYHNPVKKSKVNDQLLTHFKNLKKKNKLTKEDSDALYQRLMDRQGRKKDRIAEAKRKYKREEYSECTYKPKINRKKGYRRNMKGISNRVGEILECREKKKEEIKKRRRLKEESELKNCTFKPKINRKRNSDEEEEFEFEMQEEERGKSKGPSIGDQKISFMVSRKNSFSKLRNGDETMPLRSRKMSRVPSKFKGKRSKSQILNRSDLQKKRYQRGFSPLNRSTRGKSRRKTPKLRQEKSAKRGFGIERSKSRSKKDGRMRRSIVVLNENDEFEDIDSYIQKRKLKMKKLEDLKKRKKELEKIVYKGVFRGDPEEGEEELGDEDIENLAVDFNRNIVQSNFGLQRRKSKMRNSKSNRNFPIEKRKKSRLNKSKSRTRNKKKKRRHRKNNSMVLQEKKITPRMKKKLVHSSSSSEQEEFKEHYIEFTDKENLKFIKKKQVFKEDLKSLNFVQEALVSIDDVEEADFDPSCLKSKRDFITINNEKIYFDQSTIQDIIKINRPSRLLKHKDASQYP